MQTSNPEISKSLESVYSNASTVTLVDIETKINNPSLREWDWDLTQFTPEKLLCLHNEEQRVYVASRLNNVLTSKSWDYSGIFYSNGFRVDRCISITSLGLYGPCNEKSALYEVEIQIEKFQRSTDKYRYILANRKKTITAERGKIFYVDFKHAVSILPHKWYTIKFQLDGPQTCRGENMFSALEQNVEGEVLFEFLQGSHQMPHICFTL